MTEKEGNTPVLSGELIMNPVGSHEEEGKLSIPVPEHHTTTSSYSPPRLSKHAENQAADRIPVRNNDGSQAKNDASSEMVQWYEVGKLPYYSVCGIEDHLSLKYLNCWCFSHRFIIMIFTCNDITIFEVY